MSFTYYYVNPSESTIQLAAYSSDIENTTGTISEEATCTANLIGGLQVDCNTYGVLVLVAGAVLLIALLFLLKKMG